MVRKISVIMRQNLIFMFKTLNDKFKTIFENVSYTHIYIILSRLMQVIVCEASHASFE